MIHSMSVTVRVPTMTRDQFFDWAEAQDARYEFDGFEPVAMTGGNLNHNGIALNLYHALRTRLRGTGCRPWALDAGVATIGDTVRYPDGVVTCSPVRGASRLVPNPVVVFEVISPTSGHVDRIVKVREYNAVDSIRRYVIVESASVGLTVHERLDAAQKWTVTTMIADDLLLLPEIGAEIPVAELYEGVDLPPSASDALSPP
jgi:Uma2 family endonuclease